MKTGVRTLEDELAASAAGSTNGPRSDTGSGAASRMETREIIGAKYLDYF